MLEESNEMFEYDCLEYFNEYFEDFEIEYDKIHWEDRCGWEHYLEYDIFYDMGSYECVGEECFDGDDVQCIFVGTDTSKIIDFKIGYYYQNLNGHYEDKYNGLHLSLENGQNKLWFSNMKIIRKPGISLNRNLKINDILKS
jgi:hypothetical protein